MLNDRNVRWKIAIWLMSAVLLSACSVYPIVSVCGNGVVETGETCDTAIAAGKTGACPTQADCNDNAACTTATLEGSGTCTAACKNTTITACISGDGCCPSGGTCNNNTDSDCPVVCGNGAVETGETCDTAIAADQCGACPTSCSTSALQNAGTCTAQCVGTPIKPCCGNGVVETGEQCDPPNGTTCCDSCQQGVDQTGTWIAHIITTGTISTPLDDYQNSTIDVVQRMLVSKQGSNLSLRFDICSLSTIYQIVTQSGLQSFSVTYSPKVLATFTKTETKADQCAKVGDILTFPVFTINSGWDGVVPTDNICPAPGDPEFPVTSCSGAVDSDGDGIYGITLKTKFTGLPAIDAYAGVTLSITLNGMTLKDENTNTGTTSFPTVGYVFGSTVLNSPGILNVTPDSNAVPVTAIKLAGDVPCGTVLEHCTTSSCVP